jgi:hypothetical protein
MIYLTDIRDYYRHLDVEKGIAYSDEIKALVEADKEKSRKELGNRCDKALDWIDCFIFGEARDGSGAVTDLLDKYEELLEKHKIKLDKETLQLRDKSNYFCREAKEAVIDLYKLLQE